MTTTKNSKDSWGFVVTEQTEGGKSLRGDIKPRGFSLNRLSKILATGGLGGPRTGWGPKSRPGPEGNQRDLAEMQSKKNHSQRTPGTQG